MHIPFLERWRRRHGEADSAPLADALSQDPEGAAGLLAECELLRRHAQRAGVELDDQPGSLTKLDQLVPRWRDDPDVLEWLGGDAGHYLGTVLVRTVPGARWRLRPDGQPVVLLPADREVDVLEEGRSWAATGTPELSQIYAELSEE